MAKWSRAVGGSSEAHPDGKNRQQWQINKELLCVHFGFAVNVADGIGLSFAEKLWVVSGTSISMLVSGCWKPS